MMYLGREGGKLGRRVLLGLTIGSVLARPCVAAVPPPSETPAKIIVNGRTSRAVDVKIVKVGQELPDTFSAPNCRSIPGYTWYVSEHFALRSQVDERQSRDYLLMAELAYPHYVWVLGRQPEGTGVKRIALSFSRNLKELQNATDVDKQYWRGGGGGVTMWGNGMSYNYPGGGLVAHRRGLVIHENLHAFHMANNGYGNGLHGWPSMFFEGITYSMESHVYDPVKNELTVLVFDRATGNNYIEGALAYIHKNSVTAEELMWKGVPGLGYNPGVFSVWLHFMWEDVDRRMKLNIWRDSMFEKGKKQGASLKELFSPPEDINRDWKAWVDKRQTSFHNVDWGREQEGDTFWPYGYPNWARYVQDNIMLLLKDAPTVDPYVMDWPVYAPETHLVGPVQRGVEEPSVGCLIDFSRAVHRSSGFGIGGLGFGVGGTGKQANGKSNVDQEYLSFLVFNLGRSSGARLLLDGKPLGLEARTEAFAPDFVAAARKHGTRVGMTVQVATNAVRVELRVGAPGAVKIHRSEYAISDEIRERILSKPWCMLSRESTVGITLYPDVKRYETADNSRPAPRGRRRFLPEEETYRLYRAAWHLGDLAPASLISLKERLAASESKGLRAQELMVAVYKDKIKDVAKDIAECKDRERAKLALAELRGVRKYVPVPAPAPKVDAEAPKDDSGTKTDTNRGAEGMGGQIITPATVSKTAETPKPPVRAAQAISREKDHDGKWWLDKHNGIVKRVKQGNADLVMVGDSLTDAWAWGSGGAPVWKEYYAKRNAVNVGIAGDKTENVIWRLRHGAVDGISPKLAIVMIGTNNTGLSGDTPEDIAAGIKMILKELRTRLPETKILLLGVFPREWAPNHKFRKNNEAVNAIISGYANNKTIFYLDIGDRFLNQQGNWIGGITGDCVHINTRGYQIWAKAMEPVVRKLMGEATPVAE